MTLLSSLNPFQILHPLGLKSPCARLSIFLGIESQLFVGYHFLEGFSGICCPLDIGKTVKGLRVRMCARDLVNSGYRGHLLSLYWAPSSSNEFKVNPKDILFENLFFHFCFLVVCDLRLMRWIYYLLVSRRQALERKKAAGMMGSSSMQERQRRVSEAIHYGVLRLKL